MDLVEFNPQIFREELPAGEDGNIFHHRLPAIPEAGSLHRSALQNAAQLVHDQRSQGLTFHILSNDQQRLSRPGHFLEQREEIVQRGNLSLMNQDQRIFQDTLHTVLVGDEVGGEVPAVELHSLYHLELGAHGLGLLDCHNPVVAHLFDGLGQKLPDPAVAIGRDRGDIFYVFPSLDLLAQALYFFHGRVNGQVYSAFQRHGIGSCRHVLDPLTENGLSEHRRGSSPVTRDVRSLAGNFTHHPGTDVLALVLKLDLFGYGHSVLGDYRRAPFLRKHDIASSGPEGNLYRIC